MGATVSMGVMSAVCTILAYGSRDRHGIQFYKGGGDVARVSRASKHQVKDGLCGMWVCGLLCGSVYGSHPPGVATDNFTERWVPKVG